MRYASLLPDDHRYIDSIPRTPLIAVKIDEGPMIWCKLEFLNPSGSIKDRIARYILEKGWRQGLLQQGSLVMEASSGSTSIALALTCAQMNLKFIAVMPENVSRERIYIIKAYGAEVILTPADLGIAGSMKVLAEEAKKRGAFLTRQFENLDNAEAHHLWTGQEILDQMPGGVIHGIVSGVGTGGTIVGLYNAFKEAGCDAVPFIARPVSPKAIGGVECSSFSVRIPGVLECMSKIYDKDKMKDAVEISVDDELAIKTARNLIKLGFPVGPSSGLNYAAAVIAVKQLGDHAQVVTVFPDRMERYFSTELFAPWR